MRKVGRTYTSNSFPPVTLRSPYIIHNEEIVSNLYNMGFQSGNYADTILHVHQNSYRLHALILSRSPYLVHLMSTSPQTGGQRVIYVDLEREPEVTQEGFAIALGYLYSSVSLSLLRPDNARGALAAACLLGGMEYLCEYAYDACRQSIRLETIHGWLDFAGTIPIESTASSELSTLSIFGRYAQRLRDDVLQYLIVTLPSILELHAPSTSQRASQAPVQSGRDTLLDIFSRVPFDIFKTAIESPAFQIGTDQARFKFAKDAIDLRKRGIARGTGAEETVVLAFGGGNTGGSAVHVTRKLRKRPLWKYTLNTQRPYWEALFISANDDPRDHIAVMANASPVDGMGPRCYVFHTPNNHMQTRTTVTQMRGQTEAGLEVATLDWLLTRFLGTANIRGRTVLMADLADRHGTASDAHRSFTGTSPDGSPLRCTWVGLHDGSYQLWSSDNYLADFRPTNEHTDFGTSRGTMRYWFKDEQLFLEAIITLNINRWMDMNEL
ncbi:hypothetical protein EVG20_g3225 [Dentipellis fragilis]|uniref:BTB domain-containing protein n=1 Tax=Dentipellis fragilis TaxID=205917 RepID=A0A4Y9Z5F7_9AGAM|nr:hypothetical protein EVG20_g3225 [Dentipellis fragilis]